MYSRGTGNNNSIDDDDNNDNNNSNNNNDNDNNKLAKVIPREGYSCVLWMEENQRTKRKTLRAKTETKNKLN